MRTASAMLVHLELQEMRRQAVSREKALEEGGEDTGREKRQDGDRGDGQAFLRERQVRPATIRRRAESLRTARKTSCRRGVIATVHHQSSPPALDGRPAPPAPQGMPR